MASSLSVQPLYQGNGRSNNLAASYLTPSSDDPSNSPHLNPALRGSLKLGQVIDPSEYHVLRREAATAGKYINIGEGCRGVVFAPKLSHPAVVKLAKTTRRYSLETEYNIHKVVYNMMKPGGSLELDLPRVPASLLVDVQSLLTGAGHDDSIFSDYAALHEATQGRCHMDRGLCMERIRPMPEATRQLLITKYCAHEYQSRARFDPKNGDCLIRPYLGSDRGGAGYSTRRTGNTFSLRDFELALNELLDIGVDVGHLTRLMARALAILHWRGIFDARGVEFVIGVGSDYLATDDSVNNHDPGRLTTQLWLLDFDRVKHMPFTVSGVDQAVKAFMDNKPYFPRPAGKSSKQRQMWAEFTQYYIFTAGIFLTREQEWMAHMFISKVAAACA